MRRLALDARLASLAALVRQGAVFADIGTDHALLPLFLLSEGKISRAVCTDINEGPLEKAKENAREFGLFDKVEFIRTDGAAALFDLGLTDVAVCGMGGELISDIIAAAPFLKNPNINLILQPMSRPRALREYLAANGFEIVREVYSESSGKCYVAMLSRYTGATVQLDLLRAELGDFAPEYHSSAVVRKYVDTRLRTILKSAEGKMRGAEECPEELEILDAARKGGFL